MGAEPVFGDRELRLAQPWVKPFLNPRMRRLYLPQWLTASVSVVATL